MFALDWDYYRNRLDPAVGLTRLASPIRKAISEGNNALLFDNGDFEHVCAFLGWGHSDDRATWMMASADQLCAQGAE